MTDLLIRFLIGGVVVSGFAILGDVLRPKSFAGLFGAAPSIALATLGIAVLHNGEEFAALEARSMILGALAFASYAAVCGFVLIRHRFRTLTTTLLLMPVWFIMSFGMWALLIRGS
jgi:hypothetical protein